MRRLGRDDSFYLAVLWVIPEELRTSDLCMKACQHSGSALREVPEKLITSDLCMAACQQNGGALEYVPEELRTSDVCMVCGRGAWASMGLPFSHKNEKSLTLRLHAALTREPPGPLLQRP